MGNRLSILILVALVVFSNQGCATRRLPSQDSHDASPLSTPLSTLQGERTDLERTIHGRPALVSFWATWCDTCRRELDALNRLDAESSSRGDAMVVGVALGEEREVVKTFVERRGVKYVQLVDPEFRLADALGQRSVPKTIVVDRYGRIVHRGDALDWRALDALREALARP